jgi:hypothetical protein
VSAIVETSVLEVCGAAVMRDPPWCGSSFQNLTTAWRVTP